MHQWGAILIKSCLSQQALIRIPALHNQHSAQLTIFLSYTASGSRSLKLDYLSCSSGSAELPTRACDFCWPSTESYRFQLASTCTHSYAGLCLCLHVVGQACMLDGRMAKPSVTEMNIFPTVCRRLPRLGPRINSGVCYQGSSPTESFTWCIPWLSQKAPLVLTSTGILYGMVTPCLT